MRISPVKTPGPKGTGSHAESATDTAVHVHHDNPVFSLECGLCGAYPAARGVRTVIAHQEKIRMFEMVTDVLMVLTRKGMMIIFFPKPLDLFLRVPEIGDIVLFMAGLYAFVHEGIIHLVHIH